MLDSPVGVCAGQARSEYPATSVPFSKATVRPSQAGVICGIRRFAGHSIWLWEQGRLTPGSDRLAVSADPVLSRGLAPRDHARCCQTSSLDGSKWACLRLACHARVSG
jgi:hypothetical protein